MVVLTGALMMARKEATAKYVSSLFGLRPARPYTKFSLFRRPPTRLKEMGALVGSGVTRNTDIVICGYDYGPLLSELQSAAS